MRPEPLHPAFQSLPEPAREALASALEPVSFARGAVLCGPGDIQRRMFFVTGGVQMAYTETPRLYVEAFTYPPFPSALPGSFFEQKPAVLTLECLTDSSFLALPYDRLQHLFDQAPAIERLFRRLTEQLLDGVLQRHRERMTLSMEERYRTFVRRSPHLLQMVPHKYVAAYLNIDPTNFSKLFNTVRI